MAAAKHTAQASVSVKFAATHRLAGELVSECLATFIILGLGDSAAAMYTLYDPSPYQQAYWGVCIARGRTAVTLAIYVTGAVSGNGMPILRSPSRSTLCIAALHPQGAPISVRRLWAPSSGRHWCNSCSAP